MLKLLLVLGAILSLTFSPTSSMSDSLDLHSGKKITSSGDWRLEYRDALLMGEEEIIIRDVCTLVTGSDIAWLSLGFFRGFVIVSVYANVWDNPRRTNSILLHSDQTKVFMNDAVFRGKFIQTALPPNENPDDSMKMLAKAAQQESIELKKMPGEKLMGTFSGRGLAALVDRAIQCSRQNGN